MPPLGLPGDKMGDGSWRYGARGRGREKVGMESGGYYGPCLVGVPLGLLMTC